MILAIDQGTTGTTCLVVHGELEVRKPTLSRSEADCLYAGWREALGRAL